MRAGMSGLDMIESDLAFLEGSPGQSWTSALAAQTRLLGSGAAALRVSRQGLGCMGFTAFYGAPVPDAQAVEVMVRAAELGVTHFDTAEVYTGERDGQTVYNETVVGEAARRIGRDRLTIATKYFPASHGEAMTPEMTVAACRESCARLGVDQVDLYYVHRIHPSVPVEQQAEAMLAVKQAGLARHIGLSEFSPANLRLFHSICPVTCVQQEWSLVNRDLEPELLPCCRELGVGVVAYSPLCRSLLSGLVSTAAELSGGSADMRPSRYPRFAEGNLEKNAELVHGVHELAGRHGLTPAQLSLAWVENQGDDVLAIPGTTKIAHLEDNAASQSVRLTPAELEMIAAVVDPDAFVGDRFPGGKDAGTFRAQMG